MPLTVKASEARAQFPTIAKRVYEDNIEVTVIKGSKPYVKNRSHRRQCLGRREWNHVFRCILGSCGRVPRFV